MTTYQRLYAVGTLANAADHLLNRMDTDRNGTHPRDVTAAIRLLRAALTRIQQDR
jgi:hypothetical protein